MTPRLLLRLSWQTVNIGDIGHTPGALRILEQHLPEAETTLWPSSVDRGVREQLLQRWPRLKIVEGDIDSGGRATSPELAKALQENDLFENLWHRLFAIHANYPAAQERVRRFMDNVIGLQRDMAGAARRALIS